MRRSISARPANAPQPSTRPSPLSSKSPSGRAASGTTPSDAIALLQACSKTPRRPPMAAVQEPRGSRFPPATPRGSSRNRPLGNHPAKPHVRPEPPPRRWRPGTGAGASVFRVPERRPRGGTAEGAGSRGTSAGTAGASTTCRAGNTTTGRGSTRRGASAGSARRARRGRRDGGGRDDDAGVRQVRSAAAVRPRAGGIPGPPDG